MNRYGVLGESLVEHLDPPEDDEEEADDCDTCLYRGKYCEGCSGQKEEALNDEFIG